MVCRHYVQLAKVRVTAMVLVTTAVGYVLASERPIDWKGLALTVLGTGLAAIGAGAFNQLLEVDRDAKMQRTRHRPLPAGLLSRPHGFLFAVAATASGLGILNELVNPLTAILGLANVVIYTLIYTPLKPKTSLNTLIGAVCGAMPPVMGWTGAVNQVSFAPVLLGLILFLWQIPHFLSFVWLYRVDYANAGYRMVPVVDPTGRLTCLLIVLYSLSLMPVGLVVTLCGIAGCLFGAASLALGLGLFLLALQLRAAKTQRNARRVFLGSIVYLPLLLMFMVADARPAGRGPAWLAASRTVTADRQP